MGTMVDTRAVCRKVMAANQFANIHFFIGEYLLYSTAHRNLYDM